MDGSIALAKTLGVSDTIIGLTIVAVGTSMPELVTSVMAALRKHADVAYGNIVGSNIFNILGILGGIYVDTERFGPAEPLLNRRIVITMVLSVLYAGLLVGRAPFWLVTALFVAAFVATFAPPGQTLPRRLGVALIAGVLTSAVVTVVFQQVFLVRLP